MVHALPPPLFPSLLPLPPPSYSECSAAVALSDSVDSGCQHMYLESPSCGTSELDEGGGHALRALTEGELALLEAIPTSPEVAVRKMCVRVGVALWSDGLPGTLF